MSDRKPSPFKTLLDSDVCTLIEAAEDVYQIRFKNRAANAYLVRGSSRTIMIDVGLSSNYPHLADMPRPSRRARPTKIDMVVLSHEHLDHIGAAYHFHGRTYHRRASAGRQQDHAARRLLDAAQDVQRAERADQHRHLAGGRQSDRPRQFPPQRDVHAGPHLGLHHAVRAGQGPVVRRRHADARRRDGRRVRLRQHRRLHPVAGAAEGPELEDPAVRATAGCPTRRRTTCGSRSSARTRCCRTPRNCSTRSMRDRISSRSCSRCATSTSSTTADWLRA